MRPELSFSYDVDVRPIAGKCSACGEQMPALPTDPRDNVDAILWLSHHFIIHQQLKHPVVLATEAADNTGLQAR